MDEVFIDFCYVYLPYIMYSAYKAKHFNYADIFANSLALLYNQHVKSQEAIEPKTKKEKQINKKWPNHLLA